MDTENIPPQAPELGLTRRLLGMFHVTGVFWYRFHRWGVSVLPEWAIHLFVALFTTFFFLVLRRIRSAIASNLEVILGPCSWWRRQVRIYRTLWNFAWCLSERYERLSLGRDIDVEKVDEQWWNEALESPEGLVLVTAHIGHWELGAMVAPGRHVHVVREEEMDPQAQEFIQELFSQQGEAQFTMHFAHHDPSLGPRLLGALRQGDFIAVQGDRPRSAGRTFQAEIFGHPLDIPLGPAALARAAKVSLLPAFVFRRGRHAAEVVFRPPIRVETGSGPGARDRELAEIGRRIAAEVEQAIRRDPYQWFCFRELWPEQDKCPKAET